MSKQKYSLIALAVATVSRLVVSYFPDTHLIGGVDFVGHVQPIWFVSKFLNLGWDTFWYAGYPVLKFNSPVLYFIGASFTTFVDPIIATKLLTDIFFLLAPFAFYALLLQFGIKDKIRAVAVLAFSFFPSLIYFFWSNSIPTTVSLVFAILSWVALNSYYKSGEQKDAAFSIMFIGLTVLTHQLTAIFNIGLLAVWCLARYRRFPVLIFAAAIVVSAFWLGPFVVEYSEPLAIKSIEANMAFFNAVAAYIGVLPSGILAALLVFSVFYSAMRSKTKDVIPLIAVLAAAAAVLIFFPYARIISLIAIPFALLLGALSEQRAMLALSVIFVVFSAGIFFTFEDFFYLKEDPQPFDVPSAKNRVIYYPMKDVCIGDVCSGSYYTSYLPLLAGQEVMWGLRIQYLKQTEGKDEYFSSLYTPLEYTDQKTYDLLAAGFVNSVVVQKNYPDYVNYFSDSPLFQKTSEDDNFIVFSLNPAPSYLELDGDPLNSETVRDKNSITSGFLCSPGTLTIKEGFDSWWVARLNKEPVQIQPDENGFMTAQITSSGDCILEMEYSMPPVYYAFYALAIAALLYSGILYFRRP